jgi:hypothetical protein
MSIMNAKATTPNAVINQYLTCRGTGLGADPEPLPPIRLRE